MTQTTQEHETAAAGDRPGGGMLVLYLALGGLAFATLQSLVSPALSTIGRELGASTADVSWVVTAYLLSASVLTPVLGRLGDMVGKRRVLIGVLTILAAGTLVAALAPNLTVLIVARVLQGASGAILPLSLGMVRDELPRKRVPGMVAVLSAISGIGAGVGIVAAGPIVEHLSWHWLFWMPLVLVVIALFGAVFGMQESPVRTPGRLDWLGTGILSVTLVALLMGISKGQSWGWADAKTIGLLALGAAGLLAFVLIELRVKEALIDMRLMRNRTVWATDLVGLIMGFAMFGAFLVIPMLLQLPAALGYGFGKPVSQIGLYLLPTVVGLVVFGVVAGALVRRFGPKLPMVLGAVLVTIAFAVPAIAHDQIWQLLLSGSLTGAGIGLAFAAMSNAIIEAVPATQTGQATSVNAIARTIGSSIGTAVIAALITANVSPQGVPTDDAFTIAFWTCSGVAVLAIGAALAVPSARRRHEQSVAAGVDDLPPEPVELHLPHRQHA
ncbi:MFS transporter [Actinoplanes sp. NBRC 101535]|uniref:MFS transporter n=1 Tax=Actinoplanes sp. NBRC 101535 TaxID=3032196 RepID=UPI0024A3B7AE|nr:MFS transporter [Actinoplanes sp. NBRC 101535]GLY05445.1 MFS transporter [Actinoplanes sp. NBRC 101535]